MKPHNAAAKSTVAGWVKKYGLCLALLLEFLNHILPIQHPHHMQGSLVYHYQISLKEDLGPINVLKQTYLEI